jgi:hypothetical protein
MKESHLAVTAAEETYAALSDNIFLYLLTRKIDNRNTHTAMKFHRRHPGASQPDHQLQPERSPVFHFSSVLSTSDSFISTPPRPVMKS